MNRRLWIVSAAVGVVAVAAAVVVNNRPPDPPPAESPVSASDLPRLAFADDWGGRSVRVAYPLALTPTADPLVWEFRPGHPSHVVPPSHRLHFDSAPMISGPPPHVVVGTVGGISGDTAKRPSGVPGVVTLHACRVLRASP